MSDAKNLTTLISELIMWEQVHPDHPQRCQGVNNHGQCRNKSMDGSDFCPAHGGNRGVEKAKRTELRNYRLAKHKSRLLELGNSDNIINLRDEIAILRMLIEEKIERCTDAHALIMMSGPLSDLVMKVEKLVTSCNRLESKLGNLLDRSKVLQFAQTIIQIISNNLDDEEIIDTIAEEILNTLQEEG